MFQFTVLHHSLSLKKTRTGTQSGQEPEAGADTEAVEGAAYWLVLLDFQYAFYRTQDHLPRDGTTHNRLGPPM